MTPRSLLIRCVAPPVEDEGEIEGWLTTRIRTLAGDGALLYHFAASPDGAPEKRRDAWVVEVEPSEQTWEPRTISLLLAEMRMLGLNPAVFRVGGSETATDVPATEG